MLSDVTKVIITGSIKEFVVKRNGAGRTVIGFSWSIGFMYVFFQPGEVEPDPAGGNRLCPSV